MSSGRGNDMKEGASFKADPSAKVDPSKDFEGEKEETKAEWLKRRNKEDKKHKAGLKVVDVWFEIVNGKKLVKKMRKNNGGVYSSYVCNMKKKENQEVWRNLVKDADDQGNVIYRLKEKSKENDKAKGKDK